MKPAFRLLALILLGVGTTTLAADKSPIPPKDAMWTIFCQSFSGPVRVEQAKRAKELMLKETGMKNWYLIHGETESELYYGYYRTIASDSVDQNDREEAQRAHADLSRIRQYSTPSGERPYGTSLLMPLSATGDDGDPKWNIYNAPPEAYWTLLIGVYRDNPEYKKAAIEAVKQLRSQGVQAYYIHDTGASSVMVGTFPRDAVATQKEEDTRAGKDEEVIVMTAPLPPGAPRTLVKDGKRIRIIAPQADVQDERLLRLMSDYPNFHVNGEVMGRNITNPDTKRKEFVADRSLLLIIPRRKTSALSPAAPPQPTPSATPMITPPAKKPAGGGKLKSLD